jgi:hypothetical protein
MPRSVTAYTPTNRFAKRHTQEHLTGLIGDLDEPINAETPFVQHALAHKLAGTLNRFSPRSREVGKVAALRVVGDLRAISDVQKEESHREPL